MLLIDRKNEGYENEAVKVNEIEERRVPNNITNGQNKGKQRLYSHDLYISYGFKLFLILQINQNYFWVE